MRVAIDFGNVLYDHDGQWNGGELTRPPVEGAAEAMRQLAQSHTLIIFSTRGRLKKHRERMATWLSSHGIPFHEIARAKPNADIYLDDKALYFVNWQKALYDIEIRAGRQ